MKLYAGRRGNKPLQIIIVMRNSQKHPAKAKSGFEPKQVKTMKSNIL
jgi:hypothetical protein